MRPGGPGTTKAQKTHALLERAIAHFHGGQPDVAAGLCKDILRADKRNANARYLLGVITHRQGDPKGAISLLSKSLKIAPDNPDAQNYLGVVLAETGRGGDAVKHFRRAVSLKPGFAEAYNNLGNALRQIGRRQDAAANFRSAINLEPGYAEAHNGLGVCLRDMGQLDEAALHLRKAVEADPGHADALFNLGNLLDALERHGEAAEHFLAVLNITPDLTQAYYHLVNSLQKAGRFSEALQWAQKVVSLEPDEAKAHYYLGFTLAATEQHDEAVVSFEKAIELCDDPIIKMRTLFGLCRLPTLPATSRHLALVDEALMLLPDAGDQDDDEDWTAILGFARASILDKLGQTSDAWSALREANARCDERYREAWSVDRSLHEMVLEKARARGEAAGSLEGSPAAFPLPLFVLGPSRSGKSTVERLLGSLPGVVQGYEDPIIRNVLGNVAADLEAEAAPALSELPAGQHARFGERFGDIIKAAAGDNQVLTNTNPAHIMDAAWIAEIVPNARFIFISRDRGDVALRIFMTLYNPGSNNYAYDLDKIYSYLNWYEDIARALKTTMGDRALSLAYEDIVSDPARVLGQLASFLGLEPGDRDLPLLGDDRGASAPYASYLDR